MYNKPNVKKPAGLPRIRGVVHALCLICISLAALATLCVAARAAAPAGSTAPGKNPRLASLQIEIWPEFDRPAVLVILKGEIASDVTLPADVSVRIPASSGGPAAVAYSSTAGGDLLTAQYAPEPAGGRITVKFQVPQRFFHVEFYEPIVTAAPERIFNYEWPGDLATAQLAVIVQEPAGSAGLVVTPTLESTATAQNGLRYKSAELGAFQAGKQLEVNVRYTKTDARTSTDILNPRASDSQTSTEAPKPAAPESSPSPFPFPGKRAAGIWLASVLALLVFAGVVAAIWSRQRKDAPEPKPAVAGFCPKCHAPMGAGARFCSRCGAPQV